MNAPETQFAKGPNGYVAFQVTGEGPPDIVVIDGSGNSIDLQWESPLFERWNRRLESFGRVIRFDKRGEGASDPLTASWDAGTAWDEEIADDVATVIDHAQVGSAIVLGLNAGGCPAMIFAATRPERVSGLVLVDPMVRAYERAGRRGFTPEERRALAESMHRYWGRGTSLALYAPSLMHDRRLTEWFGRYERLSMSRGEMARLFEALDFDLSVVLPRIQARTHVFYHPDGRATSDDVVDEICAAVPNSLAPVSIPGRDIAMWAPHPDWVYDEMRSFIDEIHGSPRPPVSDRRFAVVLFTDVVSSTQRLVELGDRKWAELLDIHDGIARREIERARGRFVNTTGDGVLGTFDGPTRAVMCARAISEEVRRLGIDVRTGLHAGEVELRGNDVSGIAVAIAARINDLAEAGEVLVSRTIKDLISGSDLVLEDRGVQALKGVPEDYQLFAVRR